MPSRSQRHLYEFQGTDAADEAGREVVVTITAPAAGAVENPVTLTATAFNKYGLDVSDTIKWSSDVDGVLGLGGSLAVSLSVGAHTVTALHSNITDTVAVTASDPV